MTELSVTGRELKKVRELAGYSAREFGDFLRSIGARPTTARGVYDLEYRRLVPSRHVQALQKLVGKDVFDGYLADLREREERMRREREELRRRREEEERARLEHRRQLREARLARREGTPGSIPSTQG